MGWRSVVPDMTGVVPARPRPRGRQEGEVRVLALADRMRASGCPVPHLLHTVVLEEVVIGRLSFDDVTPLYRHALIHAGAIVPCDRLRFLACPECEARL